MRLARVLAVACLRGGARAESGGAGRLRTLGQSWLSWAELDRVVAGGCVEGAVQVVCVDGAIAGVEADGAARAAGHDVTVAGLDVEVSCDRVDLAGAVAGGDVDVSVARRANFETQAPAWAMHRVGVWR